MFGLSIPKITIKLIFTGTILNIILFIFFIRTIQIPKISLMLRPKRIFFFLFFSGHQIIHFSSPSLTKLHLLNCKVFRFNGSNTTRLFIILLIRILTLTWTWTTCFIIASLLITLLRIITVVVEFFVIVRQWILDLLLIWLLWFSFFSGSLFCNGFFYIGSKLRFESGLLGGNGWFFPNHLNKYMIDYIAGDQNQR